MADDLGMVAYHAYFGPSDDPHTAWDRAGAEEQGWWRTAAQAVASEVVGPGQMVVARTYIEALELLARLSVRARGSFDPDIVAEWEQALAALTSHPAYHPGTTTEISR